MVVADDEESSLAGGIDAIANEMFHYDMRNFCRSLCTGTNVKGGDQIFDEFVSQFVNFVDEYSSDPLEVDVEQLTLYHMEEEGGIFNPPDCSSAANDDDDDATVNWDLLLDEVDHECQTDFERTRVRLTGGGGGDKQRKKKKKKKLDDETLDALAHLMSQVPDIRKSPSSKKRALVRDYLLNQQKAVENTVGQTISGPTVPLKGRRDVNVSFPVRVFSFNKLAKEMEKVNHYHGAAAQKPISRVRTSISSHCSSCPIGANLPKRIRSFPVVQQRKTPFIGEEDWEYLDDKTTALEEEKGDADPILSANPKKKKTTWYPQTAHRKFSQILLNRKGNPVGRHLSFLRKREKITCDDDGSVQVSLRDDP